MVGLTWDKQLKRLKERFGTGDLDGIVDVLATLVDADNWRPLNHSQRVLRDKAEESFTAEIAASLGLDPDEDRPEPEGGDHREVGQVTGGDVQTEGREDGERDGPGRGKRGPVNLPARRHPDQHNTDADGQRGQNRIGRPSCGRERKRKHPRHHGHSDEPSPDPAEMPRHGQFQSRIHTSPQTPLIKNAFARHRPAEPPSVPIELWQKFRRIIVCYAARTDVRPRSRFTCLSNA